MSALIAAIAGFVDSVLGLNARAPRAPSGQVPCNIFSGYMVFGCRRRDPDSS
jgi:hypothetical protein